MRLHELIETTEFNQDAVAILKAVVKPSLSNYEKTKTEADILRAKKKTKSKTAKRRVTKTDTLTWDPFGGMTGYPGGEAGQMMNTIVDG